MENYNDKIVNYIAETLTSRGETLSTAESCTGGRIAAAITSKSGASKYFVGAIVAYQNDVKTKELGVNPEDISKYDVVSKKVVEQMVKGACKKFGTTYAIATTGYTDTGSDNVGPGTVWVGVGTKDYVRAECIELALEHDREYITQVAVDYALDLFSDILKN